MHMPLSVYIYAFILTDPHYYSSLFTHSKDEIHYGIEIGGRWRFLAAAKDTVCWVVNPLLSQSKFSFACWQRGE